MPGGAPETRTLGAGVVPARPRGLISDVRLDVFAVLFALGTILHELEFVREVAAAGPLTEYMERWGRAVPTTGWPSSVGLALHLADVVVSLYLLVGRHRREGLCVLAVTFLLTQLVSPNRIPSHNSLMFGGLVTVLLLAAAEWIEGAARRGAPRPRLDWYRATVAGLAWICALTYFFAFFYKLNWTWFSPRSPGPAFLIGPLAPALDGIVAPSISRPVLAALAIYGTLVIELVLPLLLFHPGTRRLAFFIGAVFHFPMVLRGVTDFPVLTLAFYPAFLSPGDTRDLLHRLARPRAISVAGTAALTGFAIWAINSAPAALTMSRILGSVHPLLGVINTGLTYATAALFAYLIFGFAGWLVDRRAAGLGERSPQPGAEGSPGPLARRVEDGEGTVPAALALLVACLFVGNQLAPFAGLPRAGALIMFSAIAPDMRNHLLGPGLAVVDAFRYVSIAHFEPDGIDTPAARDFGVFARATRQRRSEVHLNVVRYHMDRICRSAPGGAIRLTLRMRGRPDREFADVCSEPAMRWYVPIPIGAECNPRCALVQRWARGNMRAD